MIAPIITAIIALAKAVPVLDSWIQQLTVAYIDNKIDSMKKENIDAIKLSIEKQDQRAIEKAMGSSRAGEESGVSGAIIVDSLPGVK